MRPITKLLSLLTMIVAIAGAADAALQDQWDLLVVFGFVAALQLGLLLSDLRGRAHVTVRPDLARWARERSRHTGEPLDDVIDRSVAWFQAGLYRPDRSDGT